VWVDGRTINLILLNYNKSLLLMRNVIVPKLKSISLIGQLSSLYATFQNSSPDEDLNFDLNQLAFTGPLLTLPICSYLKTTKSNYSISDNSPIKSYLDTIEFPGGVNSIPEFKEQIQKEKNYIPISILHREKPVERERLEGLFSAMVYKTVNKLETAGIQSAIYYPIAELVANIFDHSKEDKGFIFGQFYPSKNFLDICIVDRGRGLALAYKQEKNLELSDDDAIIEAMKGNSTKPDKERGYGVRTSKQVVCGALGGEFVFISGSSALVLVGKSEKLVALPNFFWRGVIIAYRIPVPSSPIDISAYLE